ncbi:MAG: 16S rRNA (cytosine(967)-C(5))-methyltransferase RsmB [Nitrospinae bacterium]|nr:16S rRNA (cytosine(967)-C(5))-methyltransferase RsmB [Nitrospinota bacterium]
MTDLPRLTALKILHKASQKGARLEPVLESHLAKEKMEDRDRAFVSELVYGVVRWRRGLDEIIQGASGRPVKAIDPYVLDILRLGLVQMTVLTKVPVSAAVNESVNLARSASSTRPSTGFVNGVLRGIIRKFGLNKKRRTVMEMAESIVPKKAPPRERLAVKYSFPDWMVKRWAAKYGEKGAETILAGSQKQAPVFFRLNVREHAAGEIEKKFAEWGIAAEKFEYVENAYRLTKGKITPRSPFFMQGHVQPQDGASMIAASLLEPAENGLSADICCGKGIKTGFFASRIRDGKIVAMDNSFLKLSHLKTNMRRQGIANVKAVATDAASPWPVKARFGAIYIDAPCSGSGLFRRHPEGKWNKGLELVHEMAKLQLAMLGRAAVELAAGGVMVYSVCSIEPEEGEEQVERFLSGDRRFKRDNIKSKRPDLAEFITQKGDILILPGQKGMDGFFAARLVRAK